MLCKCYWIVLYIVHVTAFCLGGPFFSGHGVFVFLVWRNNLLPITLTAFVCLVYGIFR